MTHTPALPHNEYRVPDGDLVRLINDDILVKLDELREKSKGGIIIPATVGDRGDAGILTTGTVLAYGFKAIGGKRINGEYVPFQKIPIPELSVGLKAAFVRYYAEQHTNKSIQHIVGPGIIRLKPLDIMLVFDAEDADRVLI